MHILCIFYDSFSSPFKHFMVLANEDTLFLVMFLGLRKLGNICYGHKMFLNKIRNIFCVASAGKRGNICVGNNVSATMCPRLPGPLNHIKIILLCSCSLLFCSPDIVQEKGTKLQFSIAFSIERSRNCACFCAFRHLVFESQSIFEHNVNRFFFSCGLLIAFFQILWAIIG